MLKCVLILSKQVNLHIHIFLNLSVKLISGFSQDMGVEKGVFKKSDKISL